MLCQGTWCAWQRRTHRAASVRAVAQSRVPTRCAARAGMRGRRCSNALARVTPQSGGVAGTAPQQQLIACSDGTLQRSQPWPAEGPGARVILRAQVTSDCIDEIADSESFGGIYQEIFRACNVSDG
jgi:hypothetical protein